MNKALLLQLIRLAGEEKIYGRIVVNNDGTYSVVVEKTTTGKCKALANAINDGMDGGDVKILHQDEELDPVDEEITKVQLPADQQEVVFKPKTQTQQLPPL